MCGNRAEPAMAGARPPHLLETTYGVYDFMPTASANYYVGSDSSPEDVNNGSTYVFSLLTFSNSAG